MDFAGSAVGRIAQFVSTTFLVFLIMIFMLGEATVFPAKVRYVFGDGMGDEDRLDEGGGGDPDRTSASRP